MDNAKPARPPAREKHLEIAAAFEELTALVRQITALRAKIVNGSVPENPLPEAATSSLLDVLTETPETVRRTCAEGRQILDEIEELLF